MPFVIWVAAVALALSTALSIHGAAAETGQQLPPIVAKQGDDDYILTRQHPGCPTNDLSGETISAIDASQPLNTPDGEEILKRVRDAGVNVVLRYYDWKNEGTRVAEDKDKNIEMNPTGFKLHCIGGGSPHFYRALQQSWNPGESILQKTLTAKERDTIFHYGLSIGVVFQHCNDIAETFADENRAAFDANRALQLASDLHQEKFTPIFFGVDDNFKSDEEVKNIKRYFDVVTKRVTGAKFLIGVYGSGSICDAVRENHPKALCWLSQSKSFLGSDLAITKMSYDIKQCLPRKWNELDPDWDPNIFNPSRKIKFWEKVAH
jgi:Domain of unknown function (DUF1906)